MKARRLIVKIVTGVLFFLLILSFAIWGIGDIFRGGGQQQELATVGETVVTQREFARTYSQEINRLSRRFNTRISGEQARAIGIPQQVLSQLITRALIDEQADRMDLLVTDEQVQNVILEEPAFRNSTGEFSLERFARALQASNLNEDHYVSTVRDDILRRQIANAVEGVTTAPRVFAERLYTHRQERRVAAYIEIDRARFEEIGDPDETTLKDYYETVADDFRAPEYRKVTLVWLRPEALMGDVAISEEDLRQIYDDRKSDYVDPERRRVEQVVLETEEEAVALRAAIEDGGSFAEVVRNETGEAPVSLGLVTRNALLPELAEEAFTISAGEIAGPVESPLGWHIMHVTEVEQADKSSFDEVRDEIREDEARRRVVESLISLANDVDDTLAGGATLEEMASSLGLDVRTIGRIDRQGNAPDGPVETLPQRERFLQTVFETDEGERSLLTETAAGGYYVVRIDEVVPPRKRPLEDVREDVVQRWKEEQRRDRAQALAEDFRSRLNDGMPLAEVAEAEGMKVSRTPAVTRDAGEDAGVPGSQFVSALFEHKSGEAFVSPISEGTAVAVVSEIQPARPGENPEAVASLQENLAQALGQDLFEQYLNALQRDFGVSVNQRLLDDVVQSY